MSSTRASGPVDEAAAGRGGGARSGPVAAGVGGVDDVHRLRMTARRDRQAWPFALVVLGLVVLVAAPFYVRDPIGSDGGGWRSPAALGPLADLGPAFVAAGAWAGLYWVVALTLAGVLVAVHYRRTAARRGIAGPLWPVVVAGLVLIVVMLGLTPRLLGLVAAPAPRAQLTIGGLQTGALALSTRGLTPLLLIALVLVVLAWTERSPALGAITALYLALALVANLYDLENLGYRAGISSFGRFGLLPNLLLPGLFLLAAGAAATLRHRRTR